MPRRIKTQRGQGRGPGQAAAVARFGAFLLLALVSLPVVLAADENIPEEEDEFFQQWLRGEDLDDLSDLDLSDPGDPEAPREEVLAPPSLWDLETILSTGVGHRDNVTSSAVNRQGGTFLLAGFESMLFRIHERFQFVLFLEAEHLEFVFDSDLPSDTLASAYTQLSAPLGEDLTAAIALRSFYLDQVIDVAILDQPDLAAEQSRGYGAALEPSVRKRWPTAFFAEAAGSAAWYEFRAPLWDYWQTGPKLATGWNPKQSEISVSAEYLWRNYSDRPNLSAEGQPIAGSQSKVGILRPDVLVRHTWGDGSWRSDSRIGFEFNRDNGEGYLDRDGFRASQRLTYDAGAWEIEGRVQYSRFDYKTQRAGGDGPRLERDLTEVGMEGRRNLGKHLEIFARYNHERADSNDPDLRYSVNTWLAGLGLTF